MLLENQQKDSMSKDIIDVSKRFFRMQALILCGFIGTQVLNFYAQIYITHRDFDNRTSAIRMHSLFPLKFAPL